MARALQRGRCAGLRVPQWLMDGTDATTVSAAGSFNRGPTWHVKASADFDGDGKADILWQGNDGTAAMWLMDGPNATFAGAAIFRSLVHDGGVVGGHLTRERWVEVISTAPAKLFGMYPRKGSVSVGADADIVVYDPNRKRTISARTHHMDVDYSCYEGRTVQGASDVVLSRGTVIVRDGQFTGRKGHGQFIKRATADYARMA